MKLIHTSDWHLGHRLYNYDRSDEEEHFFHQLGEIVKLEQPDALLVSGDVFHTGTPGNDVAKVFTDRLLEISAQCASMETLVIAGNHDSYSRLVIDEALWKRCQVHVFGLPAEDDQGNAIFTANIVKLEGKGIIAAVPFCHHRNFPVAANALAEERMVAYFRGIRNAIEKMNNDNLPTILMAHLAVGKETDFTGQKRDGVIGGEECIALETFGEGYDYVALGHIHCPQWIRSKRKFARYCGTPRAIHFDETYDHGVDVVTTETGKDPIVRTIKFDPLRRLETLGGKNGLPFNEVLKQLSEGAALPTETYIRLNVALTDNARLGPDWAEQARQAALSRGYRFCLLNPIHQEIPKVESDEHPVLTTEELKTLSYDKVLDILSVHHPLTNRQRELLKDLMEEAK